MRATVVALGCLGVAPFSWAQTPQGGWLIDVVGGPVSPANPVVTVRLLAWFDPSFEAFAGGDLDLLGDPTGAFRDPALLPVQVPPAPQPSGTSPGTPSGGNVNGIITAQLFVLGIIQPKFDNPLALWEASWTTEDFTPRSIILDTSGTTAFYLFDSRGRGTQLYPHAFAHGSGQITVVPAPATAAAALIAVLAFRRRRGEPANRPS
jgi:hypothetical protein